MKLLSWNIQWGRGMDGRVDLARIIRTIRQIGEFDVICLQEVAVNFPGLPGSRGENQVAELSAQLPGYTAIYGAATDVPNSFGGRSQFGNAIFTRLPVGQIGRHLLPWQAELTTPSMQRVLVEAVITTTEAGLLRVMTTHLEYYSHHQRQVQIDAIRHLHCEAHTLSQRKFLTGERSGAFEVFPRPMEAILCGDLNFPATAPELAQILAPFNNDTLNFHDTWSVLNPGINHAPTVGIHPVDFVDRAECYDFVLITDGLVKHLKIHGIDAETAASDHQPVWVELG
ncbi:endonuclease/exonuclease/phosphatase family protein [Nitrosomonas ureae]|uniref:Metal-dependent hydrolase, endonuclease/exonuclease/phosphatase family n=1 Tax=Nitrosomonas ureae TaxID=44577 RepID=A0A286A4R8_9PROT|nr:endonuclease/exonuclease/phosphatase family protein [Nitrosomonas ureae]SOD16860.1 Metal-dependent hydrolase, endonuclease/exonuclease/phosphatase family [Nitrosomonas ureae]